MYEEPDFDTQLTPSDMELAERLTAARPVPAAGFRGALGRYLAAHDLGYGPRPERLRATVTTYLSLGLVLIAVAALIAVGTL